MRDYSIRIEIPDGKVREIMDRLTKAQEEVSRCYDELVELGIVHVVKKEKADSGN